VLKVRQGPCAREQAGILHEAVSTISSAEAARPVTATLRRSEGLEVER